MKQKTKDNDQNFKYSGAILINLDEVGKLNDVKLEKDNNLILPVNLKIVFTKFINLFSLKLLFRLSQSSYRKLFHLSKQNIKQDNQNKEVLKVSQHFNTVARNLNILNNKDFSSHEALNRLLDIKSAANNNVIGN
jgi:hypothetical protein